jgi:hypothetical protein
MTKRSMAQLLVLLGVGATMVGCSYYARSAEQYRNDTANLLASKNAELDTCYDNALKTTPAAAGKVTVVFTVEEKTGKIANAKADPARTTAPQVLSDCVTSAINGLSLSPADQRKGLATFEYDFARQAPAPASSSAP